MRQAECTRIVAWCSALRRGAQVLLCLSLALGVLVQAAHASPTRDHAAAAAFAGADAEHPCDDDGQGTPTRHCHLASAGCALGTPEIGVVTIPEQRSVLLVGVADQVADGSVTYPLFRPPKLTLQV